MRPLARYRVSRMRIAPPAPGPQRKGLAIGIIVRDEVDVIAEWARFHLKAGAAHLFVYDDGSTDGTVAALREAVPAADVTVTPWRHRLGDARLGLALSNQLLAYAHCLSNYGGAFRWLAFLDADEFLVPVGDDDYEAALAPLDDIPALSLPWHNFGRSGHVARPADGTIRSFTRRARDVLGGRSAVTNFKWIADPTRVSAFGVHAVEIDGDPAVWNDCGARFARPKDRLSPGFYSAERLQLNHYYSRSETDLAAKIARGSVRGVAPADRERRIRRSLARIEADEVEDTRAIDWADRVGFRG